MPEMAKTEAVTPEPAPEPATDDLVARASQVKIESIQDDKYDVRELDAAIDSIKDEQVKIQMQKMRKSYERGWNNKFQTLAEQRKQIESQIQQERNWTPERVKELAKDPEFIAAAQRVANTSEDNYSTLTEPEKREIREAKELANAALQQNATLLKSQQDATLKARYANYSPEAVDSVQQQFLSGRRPATREDLWKVVDYEPAIQRAYRLGQQDRQLNLAEKATSVSPLGIAAQASDGSLPRQEGESNHNWFVRNMLHRAKQVGGQKQ